MGQEAYIRPREKLRDRGAPALTSIELLQIVIGSGNKQVSAAKIAKLVLTVIEQHGALRYEDLSKIPGLGLAKSAQIIASFELGTRFQSPAGLAISKPLYEFDRIQASSKRVLEYISVDGAGEYLHRRSEAIPDATTAVLAIKKMYANALHDRAAGLIVAIGSRSHATNELDAALLNIFKSIFDTASLLEIRVDLIWLVNQAAQQAFRRKAMQ